MLQERPSSPERNIPTAPPLVLMPEQCQAAPWCLKCSQGAAGTGKSTGLPPGNKTKILKCEVFTSTL